MQSVPAFRNEETMRVVAGKARSLQLMTVPGMDVRPTTDRIKETLFNMITNEVPGSRFLDLFAGSGGIGIEALSRGADHVVFVDKNRAAIQCVRKNLEHVKLSEDATVLQMDAVAAIAQLEQKKETFDVIFMDPPYDCGLEKQLLLRLADSMLVTEDTLIIVEASLTTEFDYLEENGYAVRKDKIYKTNRHIFIEKR